METLQRFLRVWAATVICLVLFVVLIFAMHPEEAAATPMRLLGKALFLLMFLAPYFLPAILVMAMLLFALDRAKIRQVWPYVGLWIAPAMIPLFLARDQPWLAIPAGAATGLVYWVLAGRVAGRPGLRWRDFPSWPLSRQLVAGGVALYAAFVVAGWLVMWGMMLWVTVAPPPPGEPPFQTQFEREMTARMKVAIMEFPDPQSCVGRDAQKVAPGELVRLDWEGMDSRVEAEVCIFRLLASYGDISMADDWFEGQGFRTSRRGFNSEEPYIERDGSKRVTANWSIKTKGPRFKPSSFLGRAFAEVPYSMSINATWSGDGTTLLWVNVGFNTL